MSNTDPDNNKIARINYAEIINLTANLLVSGSPSFDLLSLIFESLKGLQQSKDLQKSKPTPTENLIEIIKAGKKQGVSEMEVDIDKSNAVGINYDSLNGVEGVDVTIGVKTANHTILKVKYK